MWDFLNTNGGAVQAIAAILIAVLTIVLVGATLRYVHLTNQIARASRLQAESAQKPVLTFLRDEAATPEIPELMDHAVKGTEMLSAAASPMRIVNIGSGPALQVTWSITTGESFGGADRTTQGFTPYVAVGDSFPSWSVTHVKMAGLQFRMELECRYESLSGTKYVSKTVVDKKKVVSFKSTSLAKES